ncbi:MAG: tetratricopeptide repeat protein [Armatimonadetes bacterium]|nr:tetratricopeptide repeat protein [Armatimonadota bacterium]
MPDAERLTKAVGLWRKAYALQMEGKLEEAVTYYKASIEVLPTAEAHTFLGWTYSFMDRLDEAIEECKKAIAVDPEFGNPWNDIGAYLLQLGEPEQAIPYLQRALQTRRYDSYHFAHMNLGRAYLLLGRFEDARGAFRQALEVEPDYEPAKEALSRLIAQFN